MHVLIPTLHRATKPVGVCCHAANLAQCLAVADRVWYVTLLIGRWQQTSSEQSFSNFSKRCTRKSNTHHDRLAKYQQYNNSWISTYLITSTDYFSRILV